MRWTVVTALALSLPTIALGQSTPAEDRSPQPRNQLPAASAEPENAQAYAPPDAPEELGPSLADRGPAQRHFTLASQLDALALEENPPAVGNLPPDKIGLDRRVRVSLVHDVENDRYYKGAENQALLFELKYINWGAVTLEQQEARRGHYFTISWANHGPRADFTARFQYREVLSKEIVRTLTASMPNVKGTVRSYFAVVGKAYLSYGPVASWRFDILRGDTVVAEARSFVW